MEGESYSFGRIVIDGTEFTKDLIVLPDRVVPRWLRASGHSLDLADLGEIVAWEPEFLVVGTGAFGRMDVPVSTLEGLLRKGIQTAAERTEQACALYNERLREGVRIAGAFHLTC